MTRLIKDSREILSNLEWPAASPGMVIKVRHKSPKNVGKDIQKVEFGWPIGMPYSRPLEQRLYAVRSDITDQRIARVIFFIKANEMILLHGFVKKA